MKALKDLGLSDAELIAVDLTLGAILLNPGPVADALNVSSKSSQIVQDLAYTSKIEAAAKTASGIGGVIKNGDTNIVWGKGIQAQGLPWEDYLETVLKGFSKLKDNFKTFDFYDEVSKTAISAKTLNTSGIGYVKNPNSIYNTLTKYIDDISAFEGYYVGGNSINSSMIVTRELQLAIPQTATQVQLNQIYRAVAYGQANGIKVVVTRIN
jgi:filamentous hemagglutinin